MKTGASRANGVCVAVLLAAALVAGGCERREGVGKSMGKDVYPVPTGRAHDAAGFEKLHVGMSFAEVVKLVGQPTRDVGSGAYLLEYDVKSGGSVLLDFGADLGRLRKISGRYAKASGEEVILNETRPDAR